MGKQQLLNLFQGKRGGRRPGSGRKRIHSKGVAHRKRENCSHRTPLHVNFKYRLRIRNKEFIRLLKRAVLNSRRKGLRIVHYSVQSNHCHFIVEADNNEILSSGMRSLTVTLAMGINQGKVQLERYHLRVLRSVREAKHAVHYVLYNEQKHSGSKMIPLNEYASLRFVRKYRAWISNPEASFLDPGRSSFLEQILPS